MKYKATIILTICLTLIPLQSDTCTLSHTCPFFSTQSPTQNTSTQCTIETTRHRYTKVSSSVLGAKALLSTCRSLQCTVAPLHTPTQYPCAVHSRLAGSYVMPGESEIHVPLRLRHGFASPRPQQKISKAYKKIIIRLLNIQFKLQCIIFGNNLI